MPALVPMPEIGCGSSYDQAPVRRARIDVGPARRNQRGVVVAQRWVPGRPRPRGSPGVQDHFQLHGIGVRDWLATATPRRAPPAPAARPRTRGASARACPAVAPDVRATLLEPLAWFTEPLSTRRHRSPQEASSSGPAPPLVDALHEPCPAAAATFARITSVPQVRIPSPPPRVARWHSDQAGERTGGAVADATLGPRSFRAIRVGALLPLRRRRRRSCSCASPRGSCATSASRTRCSSTSPRSSASA